MNNIKVSVCIGVYNREKYIKDCLESIINQTYKNIEILISDNASTDRSMEIAEEILSKSNCEYKIFKQEVNRGPDFNYKFLSDMATGEYVALFHSDDIYYPDIIQKSIKIFDNSNIEKLGIVMSQTSVSINFPKNKKYNSKFLKDNCYDITYENLLDHMVNKRSNVLICPTVVVSRNCLTCFEHENRYPDANDLLEYMKILKKGFHIALIDEELEMYRIHEGQDSVLQKLKKKRMFNGQFYVLKDFLLEERNFFRMIQLLKLYFINLCRFLFRM